ncbi:DeoR/GlpR family DNA-binding transcription regulator [Homoserinibacter sp. YIM 151385]|uniref:DeoR/GlpR family DNA-binding transcription regulator n=1 Tax=Homoserinibacter sp. YIM 151385 TaxID=2985506 RepID=UPI0022F0A9F7|nr:DeoR/GlpR family DNA-binding transcription regulator [Homoserinibacter sp. YIM 151385]WBU36738.1 DeoR/GlpR family DNA-binding transcription regulator [Homoserinibacter sp. YIM 151385]
MPVEPMPAELRRERLARLVAELGFLRVADAALELAVSAVTVRADLAALEGEGRVRRVHGGAMPLSPGERESSVERSAERDAALKRAIGRRAAGLVESGSSILLDVGSTPLAVAHALVDRAQRGELSEVTVVTNGLSTALALEPAIPRLTVVVTGGTLRPLQHSLVSPVALTVLEGLHVDLAIIGGNGVDARGRVTNVNLPEAEVKRAMLASAGAGVLVADASKFGATHLGRIGELADFATLVTAGPPGEHHEAVLAAAAAAGTRILAA